MKNNLTNKEMLELFNKFHEQRANNVPLEKIKERDILVRENERLVFYVINRYFPTFTGDEDLASSAKIALVQAVDMFNPSLNTSFSTYAVTSIINYLKSRDLMDMKRKKRIPESLIISLDQPISLDELGGVITLAETPIMQDPYNFVDDVMLKEEAKEVLKNFKYLTPLEQTSLRIYISKPDSIKLTLDSIKLKRQSYAIALVKAISKLRLLCKDEKDCTINALQKRDELLKKNYPVLKSIKEYSKYRLPYKSQKDDSKGK